MIYVRFVNYINQLKMLLITLYEIHTSHITLSDYNTSHDYAKYESLNSSQILCAFYIVNQIDRVEKDARKVLKPPSLIVPQCSRKINSVQINLLNSLLVVFIVFARYEFHCENKIPSYPSTSID